ncbi:MAG: aspartate/glutamate racemase family protein [Rhodopila sp.]
MSRPVRLGMLTPSSNTVLEPVTAAMLAGLPGVSAHFSRFKVTEIALSGDALAQFDDGPILAAAELLAHARVHAIAWNGISAGWLGFDADQQLCRRITGVTGIPSGTSMLALNEVLALTHVRRLGIVTPYLPDVQDRIISNYTALGYACDADRGLGIHENFAFAEVAPEQLCAMIRSVAARKPDTIAVLCTNMHSGSLIAGLEAELGIPIYDTVATAVWKSMLLSGANPGRIVGWGRLFHLKP